MRAIKTLLAVMGVLIVAGFAFIGYEIYQRATDPDHPRSWVAADDGPTGGAPTAAAAPAEVAGTLPPGSRIGQMMVLGTRVVYHVTLPDGAEQIHVLDPRSGAVTVPVTAPADPMAARGTKAAAGAVRPPQERTAEPSISDSFRAPATAGQ